MKKGFTLMELLVYMAVISIVVLVAGQAFVDSTKFNVRTRNMITSAQQANDVSGLLKEDIAQMGTKSWKEDLGSEAWFYIDENVYMNLASGSGAIDSSSYTLTRDGAGSDDLTFRKMVYTERGIFQGVQEIRWYLKDVTNGVGKLVRTCKTISGDDAPDDCPKNDAFEVVIADAVEEFSVTPSIPGPAETGSSSSATTAFDGQIFPELSSSSSASLSFRLLPRSGPYSDTESGKSYTFVGSVSPTTGSESITISNLETNFTSDGSTVSIHKVTSLYVAEASNSPADWNTDCYEFSFVPGEVYSFEFRLNYISNNMRLFQPGKDLFALGLRKKGDGTRIASARVNDFMIYPPTSTSATQFRYGRFSVAGSAPVNACLAFTIALYSPLTHQGTISIRHFRILRELAETYRFPDVDEFYTYNPDDAEDKKHVKAFKVRVRINRHGEKSLVETEIHTPSNGVKATATE